VQNFHALAIFVAVAERRSISIAARRLGISPSGASKAVARLEERLGVKLLHRTTRNVRLTEEGAIYFDRCRQILAEIEDADNALTAAKSAPTGKLVVQLPIGFGKMVVVPALPKFIEQFPGVTLDIELADRVPNLGEERIDVSVCFGAVVDPHVVAKKLWRTKFVTCASPDYLRKNGEPRTPPDLVDHRCLAYVMPQTGQYRNWDFSDGASTTSIPVSASLNINNGEALVEVAKAGGGIITVASFIAAEAIAAGKLKVILSDYMGEGPDISVVYMPARHLSARVRAFVDFMYALVPPAPSWTRPPAPTQLGIAKNRSKAKQEVTKNSLVKQGSIRRR